MSGDVDAGPSFHTPRYAFTATSPFALNFEVGFDKQQQYSDRERCSRVL